jgi:hypothetical protein
MKTLRGGSSQGIGFSDFRTAHATFNNLMKEPQEVRQVDPKSAIQAAGVQSPIHERIVTLHHHESFASQAVHGVIDFPLI